GAATRLAAVEADVERLDARRGEQAERLRAARAAQKDALAGLRAHDADLARRAEEVNRVTVRYESAAAECERLTEALASAQAQVGEADRAFDRADDELQRAREEPRPILDASAREGLAAALELAREAEMTARLEVETTRERVRAARAHADGLVRQREREQAAADEAARRAVLRRRQREIAQGVADELPAVLDSVDRSVAEARHALHEAEQARRAVSGELRELRERDARIRERLAALTASVHGLEMQIHEKKLHLANLIERAQSELGMGEDILVAEYGPDQPVPADPADDAGEGEPADDAPYDRAGQEKRLRAAERRLAQLGRVNPLALEEFSALEQRHRFLTEQLDDLVQTRADLRTIIADLDERMQTIFADAFEDTRAAFDEMFPILFPGGQGSLTLTNPEDLLTTGIDVAVRPAGKKIERLSLLSGGERSLAAVALLTAIFKARPSPFYILDEVEAALDDANLGRLLGVFEKLRENSQLLVITHQKRTMEIADALYGVSMRQDGVSAVVGQRIVERQGA
ncbi:AAA family ATPase, partial [Microbacterium sp. ZXX196]|uniref:AAA family ATPase n=1 Tax=Microbacterium sp. ZXX196 TaxID=2609291 RepID=UPI0012B9070B